MPDHAPEFAAMEVRRHPEAQPKDLAIARRSQVLRFAQDDSYSVIPSTALEMTDRGSMPTASRFPRTTLAKFDESKILRISAGDGDHRFIGIWAVVVDGRLFVRSWNDKRTGWYRALVAHPRARLELDGRTIKARARFVRSQRIIEAVDDAYAAKYPSPGSRKYVRGFRLKRRRATTTELVPA